MAGQRRRTSRRRLTLVAMGVLASLVVASGPVSVVPASAGTQPEPTPSTGAAADPWWLSSASVPTPTASTGARPDPADADTPDVDTVASDPWWLSTSSVPPPAPDSSTPTVPGGAPARGAGRPPAFGAFLDSGPRGVWRMGALSRWLGGAELRVGHTYLPGETWSGIEGADGFLDSWSRWRRARADRLFVLNVPMLERNEAGVPDHEVRSLLRRGASGAFDAHFRTLAKRLVDRGVPDTVLVLGWEMNGVTYTHRCGPDPAAWKRYWTRIVSVMRSVPGQKFRFDFTSSRGRDAVPWTKCYPGDDVVDVIGMDAYDQPAHMSFDRQVSEPYGLRQHVRFAAAHGKPVSYPEWGLFRNGDNPVYMRRMLAWIDEHKPLYNTLTDYCPHGVWQCDDNPRSARIYRAALSGGRGQGQDSESDIDSDLDQDLDQDQGKDQGGLDPLPGPDSRPGPVPGPTGSAPPRRCSPVDLGDWVERWIGGKVCLSSDWWRRT